MSEKIAQVIQANLADELTARNALGTVGTGVGALVQTTDGSGNPVVTVGSAVAGQDYAFIRIVQVPTLQTDALGNTQRVYAPTIIQVVLEGTSGAPTTNAVATLGFIEKVMASCNKWGAEVDTYLGANGAVPVVADITGVPANTYFPDPYNPLRTQT